MAVVNSEKEAEILRYVYFNYGPGKLQSGSRVDPIDVTTEDSTDVTTEIAPPETTPKPEPADAILHIGFHDIFIEGEYLTIRSK
jgi:hypothetical protein